MTQSRCINVPAAHNITIRKTQITVLCVQSRIIDPRRLILEQSAKHPELDREKMSRNLRIRKWLSSRLAVVMPVTRVHTN